MSKLRKSLLLLSLSTMAVCGIAAVSSRKANEVNAYYTPSTTYTVETPDVYYSNISKDLDGNSLLSALRSLNLSKRKTTTPYKTMGTSADSSPYIYTDYDPATVKYDKNNQPYGTSLLSFYSGASMTGYNKEHVWPDSRGGNKVENDIHMPRPTVPAENSNRGNSKYVEGKCHSSSGWDPVTAFASNIGVYDSIRGESARIIFYCMTVSDQLVLDDTDTGGTLSVTMGKLSDLLKWNLENPVNSREINRNNGAQYLQGNRNAFVDHPEYACKIWGTYNSATQKICQAYAKQLTSINLSGTPTQTTYYDGESFNSAGLTVTAYFDDESSSDVTKFVTWSKPTLGSSSVTGTYTYNGETKSVTVNGISVVQGTKEVTGVSLDKTYGSLKIGEKLQLVPTITPADAANKNVTWSSDDTSVASVTTSGEVTGIGEGFATITVKTVDGNFTATCEIEVTSSGGLTDPVQVELNFVNKKTVTDTAGNTWTADGNCSQGSYLNMKNGGKITSTDIKVDVNKPIHVKAVIGSYGGVKSNINVYAINSSGTKVTNTGTQQAASSKENEVDFTLTFTDKSSDTINIVFEESGGDSSHSLRFWRAAVGYTPKGSSPTPKVNSINLPSKLNIEKTTSNTGTITPIVDADEGAEYEISWSSSDESVATVSGDNSLATVTALKAGTTTITASIGDLSDTCVVTVTENIVPPTPVVHSIELPESLSIDINKSYTGTLVPTVSADDGASYSISWSSSDTSVATVSGTNSSAIVTAKKEGATIITARIGDLSDTCVVTVSNSYVPPTPVVHSITLQETLSIDLKTISSKTITPMVDADEGATYTISWSSSDTSVATVSGNNSSATIVALKEGTTTITASIGDKTATCLVTVTNSYVPPTPVVRSISIQSTLSIDFDICSSKDIIPLVDADEGAEYEISWSSSDETIVTVSGDNSFATVTALKEGTATITARIGDLSDTCVVTVTKSIVPPILPIVRSIVLPNTLSIDLATEDHKTITPIVDADEGAEYDIHWSSSDTSIVTISGNNNSATLVAHKEGTVSIMASFGGLYDTCDVTVTKSIVPPILPIVRSIDLPNTLSIDLATEDHKTITPIVDADEGAEYDIHWSSSDTSIVSISGNNNSATLVAHKEGTVSIMASFGGLYDTCDVTVTRSVVPPTPVKELVEWVVTKYPDKSLYNVGDVFNPTGIKAEAHYIDGSSDDISNELIIGNADLSKAGTAQVKVTYKQTSKFIKIEVTDLEITALNIVENPAKLNYFASESFNTIGLIVEAVFGENEYTKDVTNLVSIEYDFAISNVVKVSFGGITKIIRVTIEQGEITNAHIAVDYTYIFKEEIKGLSSENVTLEIWKVLEHYYNSLDEGAQKVLRDTVVNIAKGSVSAASDDSEKLTECLKKYDEIYLKNKDKGFKDFMERDPKVPTPVDPVDPNKDKGGISLPLVIGVIAGILVLTIVIIIIAVSAHKKGKRKNA